jgi:hypothetical protein
VKEVAMPIHINWTCLEDRWDEVRRKLGAIFQREPYGNFMDVYLPFEVVVGKLYDNGFAFRIDKHPSYRAWIQINA